MRALVMAVALILLATAVAASEVRRPPITEIAATAQAPSADWHQWDSFLTFAVKRLSQDMSGDLRDALGEVLLDARYQLVRTLEPSWPVPRDPVPTLFLYAWRRLEPVLNQAVAVLPKQTAQQYTTFIGAMNNLSALGELGFRLGLVRLSPDVLRGLARTLEPTLSVDPVAYNLDVDSTLRALLGFGVPLPVPKPSPAVEHSWLRKPMFRFDNRHAFRSIELIGTASAAEPDVAKLNQWVPELDELRPYLALVRDLLKDVGAAVLAKDETANEFGVLFIHTVLAAAWQESCWRQFIKKGDKLVPLSSPTGDVGLMQVNRHIWRGVYDTKGLSADIEYNGRAGSEILFYYLTRYAIKNNEQKKPGGHLARAIYAAYNGGPVNLARYRARSRPLATKKIDDLFWEKYQAVSSGNELAVERCYGS